MYVYDIVSLYECICLSWCYMKVCLCNMFNQTYSLSQRVSWVLYSAVCMYNSSVLCVWLCVLCIVCYEFCVYCVEVHSTFCQLSCQQSCVQKYDQLDCIFLLKVTHREEERERESEKVLISLIIKLSLEPCFLALLCLCVCVFSYL